MLSIAGIFESRSAAERAAGQLDVADERISVVAPSPREQEDQDIGWALGGVMGGSAGLAVGSTAGMAAASMVVPGVGPVLATGIIAGLLLGAGGAAVGARAGRKLDEANAADPAHDPYDRFFFHEALRRGRSIVLVLAETEEEAAAIRGKLAASGGKELDAVREVWWSDIREEERVAYRGDFAAAEQEYQRGFEAALKPTSRGQGGPNDGSEAYRSGYDRGQQYFQKLYGERLSAE